MKKDNRLDNINWLVNPWFDIILLAGFPIGLMITALPLISFPSHFVKFILYAETITNFPHMFAGFTVGYVGQKEWMKKPLSFIVIPLFLFIAVIIFSVYGYFKQIFIIRALWGSYHIFAQNHFILGIHKSLNNDFQRFDKILDISAIMIATFLSAFWFFINKRISGLLMILAWITVIAFIARQVQLLIQRKKTSLFFKTSMVSSFASAFYYPVIITKNAFGAIRAGITTHNLQYLAWCWLYYRRSFKAGLSRGKKDIALLARLPLYIILFAIIGLVCLLYVRRAMFVPGGLIFTGIFYSAFAYVHFFLEPHTWKIAKNQAILPNN